MVWLSLETRVGLPSDWMNQPPEAIKTATNMIMKRNKRMQEGNR